MVRPEVQAIVDSMTPEEVQEVTENLLKTERRRSRYSAIAAAAMLESNLRVVKRYDLAAQVQQILNELYKLEI